MRRGKFGKEQLKKEFRAAVLVTIGGFALAVLAILKDFDGSLPWITAIMGTPWAAYGASKVSYNNKTMKESLPYCEAEAAIIKRDA